MSLCRIKTVEQLRGYSPGEFGKLVGLDRVPEVRCLREKLDQLSLDDSAEKWGALSAGSGWRPTPKLPAHFILTAMCGYIMQQNKITEKIRIPRPSLSSRCCDYWVNDAVGNPFFVVEKTVDPGCSRLWKAILSPPVADVPGSPARRNEKQIPTSAGSPLFLTVKDTVPPFLSACGENTGISCITYHKFPGGAWPEEWFDEQEVTMPQGETLTMRLAEMGSLVGSGKDAVWMREVRKLTDSGHQTSLISTAYALPHIQLARRCLAGGVRKTSSVT